METQVHVRETTQNRVLFAARLRPELRCDNVDSNELLEVHGDVLQHRSTDSEGSRVQHFAPDLLIPPGAPTEEIFGCTVGPMVADAYEGLASALMLYGVTGSGKTFTVRELFPRMLQAIFQRKADLAKEGLHTDVRLEAFEIYANRLYDLLPDHEHQLLGQREAKAEARPGPQLQHRVGGGPGKHFVERRANVSKAHIDNAHEADWLFRLASRRRTTDGTHNNQRSSRSHALFLLHVTTTQPGPSPSLPAGPHAGAHMLTGRADTGKRTEGLVGLVDLAGSEPEGATVGLCAEVGRERKHINMSLHNFADILRRLAVAASPEHVDFGASNDKLAREMKRFCSGRVRVVFMVCVAPRPSQASNTMPHMLKSLDLGRTAQCIKTHLTPRIQYVCGGEASRQLQALAEENRALRAQLAAGGQGGAGDDVDALRVQLAALQQALKEARWETEHWQRRCAALEAGPAQPHTAAQGQATGAPRHSAADKGQREPTVPAKQHGSKQKRRPLATLSQGGTQDKENLKPQGTCEKVGASKYERLKRKYEARGWHLARSEQQARELAEQLEEAQRLLAAQGPKKKQTAKAPATQWAEDWWSESSGSEADNPLLDPDYVPSPRAMHCLALPASPPANRHRLAL